MSRYTIRTGDALPRGSIWIILAFAIVFRACENVEKRPPPMQPTNTQKTKP